MKILSAQQIREADHYAILNTPISSIELMENAANAFVNWFCNQYDHSVSVVILAGQGNNGGDGLAIARILSQKSFNVIVFIVTHTAKPSTDFKVNCERLANHLQLQTINTDQQIPDFSSENIYIDALLGSGLSRPATGILASIIQKLNSSAVPIVSVDIASGLYVDKLNEPEDSIIKPLFTISFQLPKLAFLFPQNDQFVGNWQLVDIGLSQKFIEQTNTPYYYSNSKTIKELVTPRSKYAHKGTFGHALMIAGSYGKMGAAVLAGKACLRSGAGLLTMHIPECGYEIVQISLPEAMVSVDQEREFCSQLPYLASYTTIGIGPGIDKKPATQVLLQQLLSQYAKPMVIDADALNILSENQDWLSQIPKNSILTPHPKEFERLVGKSKNEMVRLQKAIEFCQKYETIICLKGAHTAVILPNGKVHFNATGNPGMSTGGTGDALTGIITGLLAQGYTPENAAIIGVYEHGLAGDKAAKIKGERALLASDLIDNIRIE